MEKVVTSKNKKPGKKYVKAHKPGKIVSAGRKSSKKKRIRNYLIIILSSILILALVIWLAELDWDEIINRE